MGNTEDIVLSVSNIRKNLGDNTVIDALSFQLPKSTILAILGPNGAGKTTLIQTIMGLYQLDAGQIRLFGEPTATNNYAHLRARIGIQNDGAVYEELTVYENWAIWAALYNLPEDCIDTRIDELLEFFELTEKKHVKVGQLSKGMKQKVNLGRAIIHQPELLILDEPNSGLDPTAIEKLTQLLHAIAIKYQTAIIMCTHQLSGLESIANYVGIMNHGRLVVYGETQAVIQARWPELAYSIEVDATDDIPAICAPFGSVTVGAHDFVIQLKQGDISDVVATLVQYHKKVYRVNPVLHTIKELYAHCIGGAQDVNEAN